MCCCQLMYAGPALILLIQVMYSPVLLTLCGSVTTIAFSVLGLRLNSLSSFQSCFWFFRHLMSITSSEFWIRFLAFLFELYGNY